jgi:hypothetical protein
VLPLTLDVPSSPGATTPTMLAKCCCGRPQRRAGAITGSAKDVDGQRNEKSNLERRREYHDAAFDDDAMPTTAG